MSQLSEILLDLRDAASLQEGLILKSESEANELVLWTTPDLLPTLAQFLRNDSSAQCSQLMDITAIDYPGRSPRFVLAYQFLSLKLNLRVRAKLAIDEHQGVPTLEGLFPSASWYEREVWDMYGLFFEGNRDLRRILTDYGFEGHPLRKDFPLTGHSQVRYDAEEKRVVYEPVNLAQEYRSFDFLSPWEGLTRLPGDEKAEGRDS
ncbi:MAG: NADH-quinone oxidoreductase subunit C [Alphaproteobacteria bacterium]